jgi:hypothetical protein
MSAGSEGQVQSIWKSLSVQSVSITPEQMRVRAARFETETSKRNRTDLVSFALLLLMSVGGAVVAKNMLVRAGALLLALWALVGMYSVRRFHSLTAPGSAESMGVTGSTWYRQQLERQRDVALSRPWGIALAMPAICLLLLGYVDAGAPQNVVAILGGISVLGGIAVVIHGKILAGRLQHEIELLHAAERDWKSRG